MFPAWRSDFRSTWQPAAHGIADRCATGDKWRNFLHFSELREIEFSGFLMVSKWIAMTFWCSASSSNQFKQDWNDNLQPSISHVYLRMAAWPNLPNYLLHVCKSNVTHTTWFFLGPSHGTCSLLQLASILPCDARIWWRKYTPHTHNKKASFLANFCTKECTLTSAHVESASLGHEQKKSQVLQLWLLIQWLID